jgi:hypothetical protein
MLRKIIKIVQLFKDELNDDTDLNKKATEEFLKACGGWNDSRTAAEQISDICGARRSRRDMEPLYIMDTL